MPIARGSKGFSDYKFAMAPNEDQEDLNKKEEEVIELVEPFIPNVTPGVSSPLKAADEKKEMGHKPQFEIAYESFTP